MFFSEKERSCCCGLHTTRRENPRQNVREVIQRIMKNNDSFPWKFPFLVSYSFIFRTLVMRRCFSQIAFLIIPNMWSSLMWTNTICLRLFSVISRKLSASKKLGLKLCCVYQPGIRKKSTLSVLNPFSSCHLWKPNQCWPFLEFVFTTIDYLEDCCFA